MSSDAIDTPPGARWHTSASGAAAAGFVAVLMLVAGVGYLGVPATTDLALRVLTEPPASRQP